MQKIHIGVIIQADLEVEVPRDGRLLKIPGHVPRGPGLQNLPIHFWPTSLYSRYIQYMGRVNSDYVCAIRMPYRTLAGRPEIDKSVLTCVLNLCYNTVNA